MSLLRRVARVGRPGVVGPSVVSRLQGVEEGVRNTRQERQGLVTTAF